MKTDFEKWIFAVGFMLFFTASVLSQEPTPPDESIKILTEEVHLNISAQYSNGRFVPTLTKDDLLVVESGDPQTITSMARVPANVLLLLDTGSEFNFGKSLDLTRITAKIVIENLQPSDTLAAIQYYDKIETISDWTKDKAAISADLDKKLFTGKRSRFVEAVTAAVDIFKSRPLENRHLVLISDGLETINDEAERQKALQKLLAVNITVHVISYTGLQDQRAQKATQRVKLGDGKTQPRVPDYQMEIILQTVPDGEKVSARRFLKTANEAQRVVIINLDTKMIRFVRRKRELWRINEAELENLANDTGGLFQAPKEPSTFWTFAIEIAKAIDSNYVITYTPTKPFGDTTQGEMRKVRVSSHLDGVNIRSRQKIVASRQ